MELPQLNAIYMAALDNKNYATTFFLTNLTLFIWGMCLLFKGI